MRVLGICLLAGVLIAAIAAAAVVPVRKCRICEGKGFARPGCFSTVLHPCAACKGRCALSMAKDAWLEWRLWTWDTTASRDEVFQY
jgi:hypothetical protein